LAGIAPNDTAEVPDAAAEERQERRPAGLGAVVGEAVQVVSSTSGDALRGVLKR